MSTKMGLAGVLLGAGWAGYVATLVTLQATGTTVERDALHSVGVTLWALGTIAWLGAAGEAHLCRYLRRALRDAHGLHPRPVDRARDQPVDPETIVALRSVQRRMR